MKVCDAYDVRGITLLVCVKGWCEMIIQFIHSPKSVPAWMTMGKINSDGFLTYYASPVFEMWRMLGQG